MFMCHMSLFEISAFVALFVPYEHLWVQMVCFCVCSYPQLAGIIMDKVPPMSLLASMLQPCRWDFWVLDFA